MGVIHIAHIPLSTKNNEKILYNKHEEIRKTSERGGRCKLQDEVTNLSTDEEIKSNIKTEEKKLNVSENEAYPKSFNKKISLDVYKKLISRLVLFDSFLYMIRLGSFLSV